MNRSENALQKTIAVSRKGNPNFKGVSFPSNSNSANPKFNADFDEKRQVALDQKYEKTTLENFFLKTHVNFVILSQ